jgi:predicted HTH domain antitoxin
MVAARATGLTFARIAELVGMSRQRVMELLEREAAR